MKEDIVINGVSVKALKEQKAAISQGASKLVSEQIEKALALFETLKEADSKETADILATEIYELLDTAQVVAGVSGVTFMLPYYEEYGSYSYNDTISGYLEECDNENLVYDWKNKSPIYKLAQLASSMESDSCNWHSSMC